MAEIQALQQLEQKLNQVILGKPHAVRLALCCLLSEGHLLIEDLPGLGKTTLAHALALSLGVRHDCPALLDFVCPGVGRRARARSGLAFMTGRLKVSP